MKKYSNSPGCQDGIRAWRGWEGIATRYFSPGAAYNSERKRRTTRKNRPGVSMVNRSENTPSADKVSSAKVFSVRDMGSVHATRRITSPAHSGALPSMVTGRASLCAHKVYPRGRRRAEIKRSRKASIRFMKAYVLGYELADVTAVAVNVAYDGGAVGSEFRCGDEKNRFQPRIDLSVHLCDGSLEAEVARVADAAEDEPRVFLHAEVGGESTVVFDLHLVGVGEGVRDPFFALFEGEHGLFGGVHPYGDDDFIEKGKCAVHDVFVSFGNGVEGSRKDCDSAHSFRAFLIFMHFSKIGAKRSRRNMVCGSLWALCGSGWTSKNSPSAPVATAERAMASIISGLPPVTPSV